MGCLESKSKKQVQQDKQQDHQKQIKDQLNQQEQYSARYSKYSTSSYLEDDIPQTDTERNIFILPENDNNVPLTQRKSRLRQNQRENTANTYDLYYATSTNRVLETQRSESILLNNNNKMQQSQILKKQRRKIQKRDDEYDENLYQQYKNSKGTPLKPVHRSSLLTNRMENSHTFNFNLNTQNSQEMCRPSIPKLPLDGVQTLNQIDSIEILHTEEREMETSKNINLIKNTDLSQSKNNAGGMVQSKQRRFKTKGSGMKFNLESSNNLIQQQQS